MTRAVWLVALAAACAQPPADGTPSFGDSTAEAPQGLRIWAADRELREWVLTAAPRLERATGLVVSAVDDTYAVPMFWSTRGTDEGWLGLAHDGPGVADFVAIDAHTPLELRETVVLHEILHALGAAHIGTGEGVLSPEIWLPFRLTAADLDAVCSVRACSAFAPEG